MSSAERAKLAWKQKMAFPGQERSVERMRKRFEATKESKETEAKRREDEERRRRADRRSVSPTKQLAGPSISSTLSSVRSRPAAPATPSPTKATKKSEGRARSEKRPSRVSVGGVPGTSGVGKKSPLKRVRSVSASKAVETKKVKEADGGGVAEEEKKVVKRGRPIGWRKGMGGGYLVFKGLKKASPLKAARKAVQQRARAVVSGLRKKYGREKTPSAKTPANTGGRNKKGRVSFAAGGGSSGRKKVAKISPMKTRTLQKKLEKEENSLVPRCVLCRSRRGDLHACAECSATYHLRKCCRYSPEAAAFIESGRRARWLCARCTACAHCNEYICDPHNVECRVCAVTYHGKCAEKGGKMVDSSFTCIGCMKKGHGMGAAAASSSSPQGAKEGGEERKERKKSGAKGAMKGWQFVARGNEGEEEARRIEERDALYDQLMEQITKGKNGSNANSPSKFGCISTSPQKMKKIALDSDVDLFEAAKAALAAEKSAATSSTAPPPSSSALAASSSRSSLPSTSRGLFKKSRSSTPSSASPSPSSHQWIHVGSRKEKMKSVYGSPYPQEIVESPNVYICPFCLRANNSPDTFRIHQMQCTWNCPPGNEIYRDTERKISFFEVDGAVEKLYCRRVCLVGKLFISSKTLVDEVETFLFYVLVEHASDGCEFVGYFSKEKNPSKNNNLSCILTLPSAMRSGYGRLLIDLSYELSRIERKIGSPEHPLSDLGLIAYRGFWRSSILCYLRSLRGTQVASIKQISLATRIAPHDVINQLMRDGLLFYRDGVYYVNTEERAYRMPLAMTRRKTIDHAKLKWAPEDDKHENLDSSKLNYYV